MWFESNVCLLRTIVHKYLLKTNKLRIPKMWFNTFHSGDNLIEVQNHKNFQLCWTFVVELAWLAKNQPSTISHAKFRSYYISHLNINLLLQEGKWNKYWHVKTVHFIWKVDYVWVLKTKNSLHMVFYSLFSIKDLCRKSQMNSNI